MKSYLQDKYSAIPATRRSINKLLASTAATKIKGATLTAITDNSTGNQSAGWKAVPTEKTQFQHVATVLDLALQSDFYVVANKVNNAIKVLAGSINQLITPLDSTAVITGGNGTVAVAGTIPALEKTVDGSAGGTAVVIYRHEGNNVIANMRDNLSTLLLAFNRVLDQAQRRRMMDYGEGHASSTLVLKNLPSAGTPVDAAAKTGMSKQAADAAFAVLVDNVAVLGKAITDFQTWVATQ